MIIDSQFRHDDFDNLNSTYFAVLREGSGVRADPSGWQDTLSQACEELPNLIIKKEEISRYYIDEGQALGTIKDQLVELIRNWEDRDVKLREVTIYHSLSSLSLALLIMLKRLGVQTILFETPAYGVTINQAISIGLHVVLLPTYKHDSFALNLSPAEARSHSPYALWLTQPRMSLGVDQSTEAVSRLADALSEVDYLVVDEATEQRFPSVLRDLGNHNNKKRILRLRGFLKGAGLNGIRLAFVLHDEELREKLEASQEVTGESLDIYSLRIAEAVAKQGDKVRSFLAIANGQTTSLRSKAEKLALGTRVSLSKLVNGYIGSLFIDLRNSPGSYEEKRRNLLSFCARERIPVILGATMRFAFDENFEQVRLNYFSREHHILRGVEGIVAFSSTL